MTLYRKYFPGDSWETIWDDLPMSEGLCYIAGAMSHDSVLNMFNRLEMSDGAYIGQEVKRMMKTR